MRSLSPKIPLLPIAAAGSIRPSLAFFSLGVSQLSSLYFSLLLFSRSLLARVLSSHSLFGFLFPNVVVVVVTFGTWPRFAACQKYYMAAAQPPPPHPAAVVACIQPPTSRGACPGRRRVERIARFQINLHMPHPHERSCCCTELQSPVEMSRIHQLH